MLKILVACPDNGNRSHMAEGYLKNILGTSAEIYSAGIKTQPIHPNTIQVMQQDGIDISNYTLNTMDDFRDIDFDYVIIICEENEYFPQYPYNAEIFHPNIPDPAAIASIVEITNRFIIIRDMIKSFCQRFVEEIKNKKKSN